MSGWGWMGWIRARRWQRYDAVRVALGLLLLTAAVLKTHQLATEPLVGIGVLDSRWVLIATVEFELLLALCLLANVWPNATWAVALGCFALFTCVSLYKALSGHATCGCFGRIGVNPWATVTLDTGVILALTFARPSHRATFAVPKQTRHRVFLCSLVTAYTIFGVVAGATILTSQSAWLSELTDLPEHGGTVVVQPGNWIGKRLPLERHIDIGHKFARGLWIVLFFHHGCPACREVIPEYEAMARDFSTRTRCPKVTLVECPPAADRPDGPLEASACIRGHLSGCGKITWTNCYCRM